MLQFLDALLELVGFIVDRMYLLTLLVELSVRILDLLGYILYFDAFFVPLVCVGLQLREELSLLGLDRVPT